MYQDLTPSEKFVFDWQYHIGGGFHTMLAHLFCKADEHNFEQLKAAFPIEGLGMGLYLHSEGWWKEVQLKAFEDRSNTEVLGEIEKHKHITERPPEWAHKYAQAMARQCFGLWYARPENANTILPTTQINETIDTIFSKPPYAEWNN